MRYFGGKARLGSRIADTLVELQTQFNFVGYCEPFCGAMNILSQPQLAKAFMNLPCLCSDIHVDLIALWQRLVIAHDWEPPEEVSKATYDKYKRKQTQHGSAMRAFCGFAMSFGGRFFEGYAKSDSTFRYAEAAKKKLLKKKSTLQPLHKLTFHCADFDTLQTPQNFLVYCDPPYHGTKAYSGVPKFNHQVFWEQVRNWSQNNLVVVSELEAPSDFVILSEVENVTKVRKHNVKGKRGKTDHRKEALFVHESWVKRLSQSKVSLVQRQ